jgi:hypothetical protein
MMFKILKLDFIHGIAIIFDRVYKTKKFLIVIKLGDCLE